MKNGTPAGQQLDCGVKAGFLPARISSVSFFMRSFTHGLRFGFERSGIRNVGCAPAALGTKGCAGSLVTGGTRPATDSKKGPVPFNPTHPARLDEKSGAAVLGCAAACPKAVIADSEVDRVNSRKPRRRAVMISSPSGFARIAAT